MLLRKLRKTAGFEIGEDIGFSYMSTNLTCYLGIQILFQEHNINLLDLIEKQGKERKVYIHGWRTE
jgi:hypothetical protein